MVTDNCSREIVNSSTHARCCTIFEMVVRHAAQPTFSRRYSNVVVVVVIGVVVGVVVGGVVGGVVADSLLLFLTSPGEVVVVVLRLAWYQKRNSGRKVNVTTSRVEIACVGVVDGSGRSWATDQLIS